MIIDGRHDRGLQSPSETWLLLVIQHVSNQLWTKIDCMPLMAGRSWRLREAMDIKRFRLSVLLRIYHTLFPVTRWANYDMSIGKDCR